MRSLYLLVIGLTGLTSASLASAENQQSEKQIIEMRKVVRDYSKCTVKKRKGDASKAVLENVDNAEVFKKYPKLLTNDCLHVDAELRLPGDQVKYGLANALIQDEFKAGFPADIGSREPLTHKVQSFDENAYRHSSEFRKEGEDGVQKHRHRAEAFYFLSQFGECVVRLDPAAVHQFLMSPVAEPGEQTALTKVKPLLAACISEGQTLELNLMSVRGTLAMNFYRLAHAPRVGAPTQEAGK